MLISRINKEAETIFNSKGFPNHKNENWKYTSLKKFQRLNFSKASKSDSINGLDNLSDSSVTTIDINSGSYFFKKHPNIFNIKSKIKEDFNQSLYNLIFGLDNEIIENNPFYVLNNANFDDAIIVKLNNDFNEVILNISSNNSNKNPLAHYSRIFFDVEKNCEANILINHKGSGDNMYYKNNVVIIDMNQNSNLTLTNIFDESPNSYSFNNLIVNQNRDSKFLNKSFFLNSSFVRNNIINNLNHPNSESDMAGLFIGKKNQFIDNNIKINHNSKFSISKVLYKGILDDNAHAIFNALVNVPFESDKIDSEQKNHNILLSDKAKINSNPKLKISCDDVKCAHGSTIGNLDRDALFYLRSRGINLGSAQKILLDSFMHEIIDLIDNKNIRNEVKNIIDEIL